MPRIARQVAVALAVVASPLVPDGLAQRNDKRTHSRSQYVHHIELYDADGRKVDPAADDPRPYSPERTCLKCHDVATIAHGYHFNAFDAGVDPGRRGEPMILVEPRAGTQIPVSPRDLPGVLKPSDIGVDRFALAAELGAFWPGIGKPEEEGASPRFAFTGELEIDCMVCHAADREYSHEQYAMQVKLQNFAHAPSAALGLGVVDGMTSRLKDDFDPAAEGSRDKLPRVVYDRSRFDPSGKVFFDVVREPSDDACYRCHTARPTGADLTPRWTHDGDVHLRAGIGCADCHRNGIDHHTVRGYPGEIHPSGESSTAALSCAGCHMDGDDAGRYGAPLPRHAGLPPVHLDKMSCTACHSGPLPTESPSRVQTSMAHRFAIALQSREDLAPPAIVEPVYLRDHAGIVHPYRMMWPAWFGVEGDDGELTPLPPDEAYQALRKARVRIRHDFATEIRAVKLKKADYAEVIGEEAAELPEESWNDEHRAAIDALREARADAAQRDNLVSALTWLAENKGATAVYVSGGRGYRLAADGADVEVFETDAAAPYSWPIAHDVRPARQSLGAGGCTDCHAPDAPYFHGEVAGVGPLPDDHPPATSRHELTGEDPALMRAWEQLFRGRAAFKWSGIAAVSLLGLIVLAFLLVGLFGWLGGRRSAA